MQIHKPIEYPNIGFRDFILSRRVGILGKTFSDLENGSFLDDIRQKYLMFLMYFRNWHDKHKPIMYEGKKSTITVFKGGTTRTFFGRKL